MRPRSGAAQWVIAQRYELSPWAPATEYVDSFGNLCQRYTIAQGKAAIEVESEIEVADQVMKVAQMNVKVEKRQAFSFVIRAAAGCCPQRKLPVCPSE